MRKRILSLLRGFFAVLGVLVLLTVLIYQFLPAKEKEKINLVFIQAYSVLNEGGKPQEVYAFHTKFFSWDSELREELSQAYPLSEEGLALLFSVRFGRIPFNHYSHGYARPFEREVWTAVSRPQLSFHEFSHVAFANLVVGEEENYGETLKRLQEALLESFTNPKYRSIFTVCYAEYRDLATFEGDPEHDFLSILEWSGGNLALVPAPLREFAPWIKEGEIQSWRQLARIYLSSDDYGRAVLELRYGEDNPLWGCAESSLSRSRFAEELSDQASPYQPSETDLVFLAAEEREIRWFLEAKREGAFAFWEEYFTEQIEGYASDLTRRLLARHPDLYEVFIVEILESWESKALSNLSRHWFSSSSWEGGPLFPWLEDGNGMGEFHFIAWDRSVGSLEDFLRSYERARGVEILSRFGLEGFFESLREGEIPAPRRVAEFFLAGASRWDGLRMRKFCLVWEEPQNLPTVITLKYDLRLLLDGKEAFVLEVEYGVPNSCYG